MIGDVLAGRDVPRQVADGFGKDARIRHSPRRASRPGRGGARCADPRAHPRVALQILVAIEGLAAARGLRAAAVYGGVGLAAQAAKAAKAHILVATPAASRT